MVVAVVVAVVVVAVVCRGGRRGRGGRGGRRRWRRRRRHRRRGPAAAAADAAAATATARRVPAPVTPSVRTCCSAGAFVTPLAHAVLGWAAAMIPCQVANSAMWGAPLRLSDGALVDLATQPDDSAASAEAGAHFVEMLYVQQAYNDQSIPAQTRITFMFDSRR